MRVSHELTIDASAAAVWELVGEPLLYPRFLRDITRWDPVSGDEGWPPALRHRGSRRSG